MSKTAAISGGLGDCIYAIPVLHKLNVKRLYVKQVALEDGSDTYTALKDLIELQGIECLPTSGNYPLHEYEPGLQFNYDMDKARLQPARGTNHIIRSYMAAFNVFVPTWRDPWLKIDDKPSCAPANKNDYSVVALTGRWRDNSKVDWKRIYREVSKPAVFIGFRQDWDKFCELYCDREGDGQFPPYYVTTANLLEAARVIRDARIIYTNQNPMLCISQGLGKTYFLEHKPFRTNTLLGGKMEHILT